MDIIKYIGAGVRMGKGVKIWHFAYVGDNTTIGDNVSIGSLAHVDYGVTIGNNVRIEGQAYIPPLSVIEDNVFIGPAAVLTNDPYPMSGALIGVKVMKGAAICAGAILKAGITVGENSVVGMGAVVVKDVPPNTVVAGNPAKPIYDKAAFDLKRRKWESSHSPAPAHKIPKQ